MNESIPPSDPEEKIFAEMLVEQGLAKAEQVEECLALQEKLRRSGATPLPRLGDLLLEKGYLSRESHQQTVLQSGGSSPVSWKKGELPASVSEALPSPENLFGKYVRVAPLGAGGMGEVWKAWDTDLGRWVALKFLKAANPDNLFRFRREAQTAGQIDHPHIAAIYEVGEKSGSPFIAMQYVDGVTLTTFPRNDIRQLVRLMRDTALAVHAAHQKGIIHRDLKPANLMIAQKESPHIYVMDFGLAKETGVDTSISQSGLVIGTPAYMSPEQAQAKHMDARSDVYSLGSTFYELLTGHPPFQDNDVLELLRKVVETDPPRIRKENPKVESDLETIVLKCLRKEPGKRYPTAAALAADLQNYLKGESISARPMGLAEKGSRWIRRNRALSATLAALLLAAVVGGAFSLLEPGWKKARTRAEVNRVLNEVRSGGALTKEEAQKELLQYQEPATIEILVKELDAVTVLLKKNRDLDPEQTQYLSFLCKTLGLLGIREGAVEALGRYLETERRGRQLRAVPAGEALCLLGGRQANKALIQTKNNFGESGHFWIQVQRLYGRIDVEPELYAETAQDYGARGTQKMDKGDLDGAIADFTRAYEMDSKYIAVLVNRGAALHAKGDLDGAIADFTRVLELDSVNTAALTNRGSIRAKKGDLKGAIKDCTKALDLDPENVGLLNNRGSLLHLRKNLDGAIADFTRALEMDPNYTKARNNRANALAERGDLTRAIEDYSHSLKLDSTDVELWFARGYAYLKNGNINLAITDFTKAIKTDPDHTKAWINRGVARKDKSDLVGAVEDFTRALKIDPESFEALNNRGNTRALMGHLEKALQDFTRSIEINPESASSWNNRGTLYRKRGDLKRAVADYTRALQLDPKNVAVWNNRGQALQDMGDFDRAIADYTRSLVLDSKQADTWYNRATARYGKKDLEGAIQDYNRVLEADSENALAWNGRGITHHAKGDLGRAIYDYTRALEFSPKMKDAWYSRGNARFQKGDLDGASADYTQTLKLDPKYILALYNRGNVRNQKKDFDGAIVDFTRILEMDPKYIPAWLGRGIMQGKKGNLSGAISDWEQLLKLSPNHAQAPAIRAEIKKMRAQLEQEKAK